ncbi:MAG: EamA family transporter [Nitrososphaeria archaeon]
MESDPYLSARVGATTSLTFFLAHIILTGERNNIKVPKTSLLYFIATRIVMSIGWLAMMTALKIGSVSIVTTIVYSYPLFTLILTKLLLKEEKFGPEKS